MLREIDSAKVAGEYFLERLKNGRSLSKYALIIFKNSPGKFAAIIPSNIYSLPISFKHGGVCGRTWAVNCLSELFCTYLKSNKNIILENALAKKGDPYIKRELIPKRYHNEEVYYEIRNNNFNDDEIKAKIHASTTANAFSGFIIDDKLLGNGEWVEDEIERISSSITHIILGAYDNESFILWEKHSGNQ